MQWTGRGSAVGNGLPSPVTLSFNRPIRALLLQINREQTNFNADDEHYEDLKTHQDKYIKGNDTYKDSFSFPIGSTLAVQNEDGGPWMHGTSEETNSTDHQGQSYIIRVIKTGRLMTDICRTPIPAQQYL